MPVTPVVVSPRRRAPPGVAAALADRTRRLGRYVLLEVLDASGPGTLHRAWDLPRGAAVLVRVLDGARRLEPVVQQAMEAVRRLRHAGLAPVRDHGVADGRVFVAMDAPPGRTLDALEPALALRALQQVIAALSYAHQQGVTHGALTAASVLVDDAGTARLVDLGAATAERADRLAARLERAGLQPKAADVPADLQAFGLLLARASVGDEALRPALVAICRRCLESDPAARYASAGEVARDLDRALAGPAGVPRAVPALTLSAPTGPIREMVFAAALLLAVLVGVMIGNAW